MGTHRFGPTSTTAAALSVAAILALTGCGAQARSSTAPLGGSSPGTTSVSAPTTHPPMVATAQDNGRTITLSVGQTLAVRLDSTYWTFTPTAPPLHAEGTPVVLRGGPCVPGQGCGSVTASFSGASAGRTTVTAERTTCGEAIRCTGTAGLYRLVVVVD